MKDQITITIPAELATDALKQAIDDIKKQIEALEAEQKPKREPQEGEYYWCIDDEGGVMQRVWYSPNTRCIAHRDYGNFYLTKEEGWAVVNRRKAQAKIDAYIREQGIENGFVHRRNNYCPAFNHNEKKVCVEAWSFIAYSAPFYVCTQEIAQQIIDAVGAETVEMAIRGRVGAV